LNLTNKYICCKIEEEEEMFFGKNKSFQTIGNRYEMLISFTKDG